MHNVKWYKFWNPNSGICGGAIIGIIIGILIVIAHNLGWLS